jgi:hypothetical protein
MSDANPHEMARLLREEAEQLERHGFTNFFEHTFSCLRYGQANKEHEEERCVDCLLRSYVEAAFREEAFACQHIDEEGWLRAAQEPGLAGRFAARLRRIAGELEAAAVGERT